jgi:hypothetical protein
MQHKPPAHPPLSGGRQLMENRWKTTEIAPLVIIVSVAVVVTCASASR